MLSMLSKSEILFLDGTFKTAPAGYYQTLILMGLNMDTNIYTPIVYAFVTAKTQQIYETFLYLVDIYAKKSKFPIIGKYIVLDFEEAIHNAAQNVFPQISRVPCFFHLVILYQ